MTAALAKAGLEVRLLTTDYRQNGASDVAGCETKIFHSVFDAWQFAPALGRIIDEEVRWADLVTIHTLWSYTTASAARACSSAGVPYILRPAGMLDEWSLSQKRIKKQIYASLIERRTINQAAALWFTSEEERRGAKSFNYQTRAFVVPLGVALADYLHLPEKGVFRKQFLNCSEKRIVLYLGRLAPKKQPDLALKAFADLSGEFEDCILVAAGPDEHGYIEKLKDLSVSLRIQDRVVFTGDLQRHEVVAALNDADVFVLPSLHENFGVAVIEAMASGTPVIVSNRVALGSVIRSSAAGLVIEPTVDALRSSLRHILSNPAIGEDMGRRGREVALNTFTWERIVPAIVNVYSETIGALQNRKRASALSS